MSTAAINLDHLVINGRSARRYHADVIGAVTAEGGGVKVRETITGASSVEMTLVDPHDKLIQSRLLQERSTIVVDDAGYELVAVSTAGTRIRTTWEALEVARLRRHKGILKAAAGTTTRAQFATRLIRSDERWIDVVADSSSRTQVEVARGSSDKSEHTWDAVGRIMGEIGWRAWARRGVVYLGPDSWVLGRGARYDLHRSSTGVIDLDIEYNAGKKASRATLKVHCGAHTLAPGSKVVVSRLGLGNGPWLVETIERTAASKVATCTLLRRQPELPEPKDSDDGDDGETGYRSGDSDDGAASGRTAPTATAKKFVDAALSRKGCTYRMGRSGPSIFDCSGLVQWAAGQAGVTLTKPAAAQWRAIQDRGRVMSVSDAIGTCGALLVRIGKGKYNHIAISLGDGRTIEAKGAAYGVVVSSAKGRGWTGAGMAPGM